jgi:hypothetical protein
MDNKKAQKWWFDRSPLLKKYLQVKYYPATNWEYLSKEQINFIYNNEKL